MDDKIINVPSVNTEPIVTSADIREGIGGNLPEVSIKNAVANLREWWKENRNTMDSGYSIGFDVALSEVEKLLTTITNKDNLK